MEKSAAHFVTLFPFDLYKRLNQRQASRFASVSSVWQGGSSDTENAQHFEFKTHNISSFYSAANAIFLTCKIFLKIVLELLNEF